jgi:hypothetical protein
MHTLFFLLAASCTPNGDDSGTPTDSGDTGTSTDTSHSGDTADSGDTNDTADSGDSGERTCVQVEADFQAETADIRSCSEAADCGQVLTGTSCGCTMDWVARNDADTTQFYSLLAEGAAMECEMGTESDCSCPETWGYDCVDEICTWDYTANDLTYATCHASDGEATTYTGLTLAGDTLVVGVSYGGGCASHWFSTCWPDQAFAESFPVQASLELLHEVSEPDPCDGWISEDVTVDLLPLKAAYQAAYGSTGTIRVNLGGQSVEYSF